MNLCRCCATGLHSYAAGNDSNSSVFDDFHIDDDFNTAEGKRARGQL